MAKMRPGWDVNAVSKAPWLYGRPVATAAVGAQLLEGRRDRSAGHRPWPGGGADPVPAGQPGRDDDRTNRGDPPWPSRAPVPVGPVTVTVGAAASDGSACT